MDLLTQSQPSALLALLGAIMASGFLCDGLATRLGWGPYFRAGWLLLPELVPIGAAPEGDGETHSVRWRVLYPSVILFWADPPRGDGPWGLHGRIDLQPGPGGVSLRVRWSPPWTPLLGALSLMALGGLRGQLVLTASVALLSMAAVMVVYRQAALRAAREVRWALMRDLG